MKDKLKPLGILVVLSGMSLSKYMGSKYGVNGRIAAGISGLVIAFIAIIILICMKEYSAALLSIFVLVPLIVILIGIYLNNVYVVLAGVILLIVFMKMIQKLLPRFSKRRK